MLNKEITGAGFVIYFDNRKNIILDKPNDILFLLLIDNNDMYDFPKGAIDPYEDSYSCAIRETEEESSLKINKNYVCLDNINKTFSDGLVMYIGEYILDVEDIQGTPNLNKNIKILPNEKTLFKEHKGFIWESNSLTIKNKLPDYLNEVLDWALLNIK